MDDLWSVFASTGKIQDYLKYKQSEQKGTLQNTDEARVQGNYYSRTDGGRER